MRENLYGFQGNQKNPYLKITVTDPKFINRVRTTIEKGGANYKGLWKSVDGGILTFDSIQYVLRFMIDTGVCHYALSSHASLTARRFRECLGLKSSLRSTRSCHSENVNQIARLKHIATFETW